MGFARGLRRSEHRNTRPSCPQTSAMANRFTGRVGSQVLGSTIRYHRRLK
jgi:hypothetical protein